MIRTSHNENDGGMVRYVYQHHSRIERAQMTAYWHDERVATYAAADLTRSYWAGKAFEVTRQFLYLRGPAGVLRDIRPRGGHARRICPSIGSCTCPASRP